jgi:hypothetical protein
MIEINRHIRLVLGGVRAMAIETVERAPRCILPRLTIAETEWTLTHWYLARILWACWRRRGGLAEDQAALGQKDCEKHESVHEDPQSIPLFFVRFQV